MLNFGLSLVVKLKLLSDGGAGELMQFRASLRSRRCDQGDSFKLFLSQRPLLSLSVGDPDPPEDLAIPGGDDRRIAGVEQGDGDRQKDDFVLGELRRRLQSHNGVGLAAASSQARGAPPLFKALRPAA